MYLSIARSFGGYWHLLRRNANFRLLWMAQIVSEIGDWFYSIAVYSLLLELTGRAESVALALVLQVLPQAFVGPLAGVVNDRISRKRVMIGADLFRMAVVAAMLLVTRETAWVIYPLLFLETIAAAFFEPARSSVVPNVVRKDELTMANTLASTTWSFNLFIGSALGGIAAVLLGREAVFVLDAASFVLSALLIWSMRFKETHVAVDRGPLTWKDAVGVTDFVEGTRYITADRKLLVTVCAKMGIGIVGTAWVLFPIMGQRTFAIDSFAGMRDSSGMLAMSMLMGARGLGALIGPLLTAPWAGLDQRRLRTGILFGFIVMGAGYVVLAGAPGVLFACAAIALAHMGGSSVWVFSTTLLHIHTVDRYRGRVFAAELGLCMLSIAVFAFAAGVALDSGMAPRTVAAATGLAMVLPATAWALFSRGFSTSASATS